MNSSAAGVDVTVVSAVLAARACREYVWLVVGPPAELYALCEFAAVLGTFFAFSRTYGVI